MNDSAKLPLDGVRIVDLTAVVMGPLATRMLADLGAEVIWVEPPGGDVLRDYAPKRSEKMSAFSMNMSRNKRSVTLDLKTPVGRQALLALIAASDVFVTSMRRGALGRLGLDEPAVRAVREDIVYCIANGYGSDGPYADRAAYDDVIQAASGLASMFAWTDGEPKLVPSIVSDKLTGVHLAFAIAAALFARARTGRGCHLEVPMAETTAAFNLVEHLDGRTFSPPMGPVGYRRVTSPHRRPRRTADGWAVVLPYSLANWNRCFEFAGRDDLVDDPRFATGASRIEHSDVLYALLDEIVREKTTAEWLTFCADHSIPASAVVDLDAIGADPHFAAVGLIRDDEHPTEGSYRYVRDPIRFDGMTAPMRRHAPRPGADTHDVFRELGWDTARIDRLTGGDD